MTPIVRKPHPKRNRRNFSRCPRLVRELFAIMDQDGVALSDAAARAGVSHATIVKWPGCYSPVLGNFEAVLNGLGYELKIVRKREETASEPAPREMVRG